jgi:hypothetical protein
METQTPTEEHFFQVSVTQEGSGHLFKLFRLVRWMIASGLLLSLIFIIQTYIRWLLQKDQDLGNFTLLRLERTITPFYIITGIILFIFQTLFYFRFVRQCTRAIESGHTPQFNRSFRYLVLHAAMTVTIIIVQLFYLLFALYIGIDMLNNIPRAS